MHQITSYKIIMQLLVKLNCVNFWFHFHEVKVHKTWDFLPWESTGEVLLLFIWKFKVILVNHFRPDPGQKEKINLNFNFRTCLRCLKRFYEDLHFFMPKVLIVLKPFNWFALHWFFHDRDLCHKSVKGLHKTF